VIKSPAARKVIESAAAKLSAAQATSAESAAAEPPADAAAVKTAAAKSAAVKATSAKAPAVAATKPAAATASQRFVIAEHQCSGQQHDRSSHQFVPHDTPLVATAEHRRLHDRCKRN
jgi:ABC-2 type transport system ATP-binding protein